MKVVFQFKQILSTNRASKTSFILHSAFLLYKVIKMLSLGSHPFRAMFWLCHLLQSIFKNQRDLKDDVVSHFMLSFYETQKSDVPNYVHACIAKIHFLCTMSTQSNNINLSFTTNYKFSINYISLVICCCITNHPALSDLNQFIISVLWNSWPILAWGLSLLCGCSEVSEASKRLDVRDISSHT